MSACVYCAGDFAWELALTKEVSRLRAEMELLVAALTPVIGEVREGAEADAAWCAVADAYDDAIRAAKAGL